MKPVMTSSGPPFQPAAASGLMFDIQRFSLHDGPGIRTTLFFKGCPLRCAWCQNPESQKAAPEIAFYHNRCVRCFQCRQVCSQDAIQEASDRRVDFGRCTHCGSCADACPQNALVMIGETWSAESLVREIERDIDFFDDSGGGVTLSGGEPMLQAPFLAVFLPRLKSRGVHVNVETCGVFRWRDMAAILASLDMVYFDLKIMDRRLHKRYTGGDNQVIHANFVRLTGVFPQVQARMPIIPDITDTEANIRAIARLLKKNNHHTIHCLPYHNMGEAKLERIQGEIDALNLPSAAPEVSDAVADCFGQEGIDAIIYD